MNRNTKLILELVILVAAAWGLAHYSSNRLQAGQRPSTPPLGAEISEAVGVLTLNIADRAAPGYNLVPLTGAARVVLLDMTGRVVHDWPVDATRARLLPNGNLLVVHGSKWGLKHEPWKGLRRTVREYSWGGKIVWEYEAPDIAHHDVQRLANGNTLFPFRQLVPLEDKLKISDESRRSLSIRSDVIREVDPSGATVRDWAAHRHLDLNSCGRSPCRSTAGSRDAGKQLSDWTHINTAGVLPENRWFDGGDRRFRPGNIITLPRNWSTVFIVDRDSGAVVWSYEGDYRGGLSGGHEAQMIPKGLPGAGNLLIFDNGRKVHANQSFILELNPVSGSLDWVYDVGGKFFSASAGSMQRLPNGNTLISEDVRQRLFEVTPAKEIVWEFRAAHMLSRARRYAVDYCEQFKKLR